MKSPITDEEIERLTNTLHREFSFDLRNYAAASLKRRVNHVLEYHNLHNISDVVKRLKENDNYIHEFINEITVNVTELFRDNDLWIKLHMSYSKLFASRKEKLLFFHVGCSSGEEIFSNLTLIHKLKINDYCETSAGDINSKVLEKASMGIISKNNIELYKHNYNSVFNDEDFHKFYEETELHLHFKKLKESECFFLLHDIVSDELPGRYDVLFCRNLLIYFNSDLQSLVIEKLYNSLKPGGLLILGAKESLIWYKKSYLFEVIDHKLKIFKKL